MWQLRLGVTLGALLGLGILGIGIGYLLAPQSMATSFGLPTWPRGEAAAFGQVKGVRDAVSGLIGAVLLLTRQWRALAWVLLTMALIPLGDAAIVLGNGGDVVTALAVHLATAVAVAVTAALLFHATRKPAPAQRRRQT